MNWYLKVLKNYAVFRGRARRKEYWYFILFNFIISLALLAVDYGLGFFDPETGLSPLEGIYSLAVLLPALAVSVRRLHDTEHSGWWLLIGFIPIVGALVLLVFFVQDGTPGDNRFGPNPKGVAA